MFFFLSLLFDAFLFEEEEEEEEEELVVGVFFPFSVRDFVERAKNTPRSKTFRTGEEEEEEEERLCNALKLPKASRRLVGVPESANIVFLLLLLLLLLLLQNPLFLLSKDESLAALKVRPLSEL
jgi:hypothetical protein